MRKYTIFALVTTVVLFTVIFFMFKTFDYNPKTSAISATIVSVAFLLISICITVEKYDNTMVEAELDQNGISNAVRLPDYPTKIISWLTRINPDLSDKCVIYLVEYIMNEWTPESFHIVSALPEDQQKLAVNSLLLSSPEICN